MTTTHDRRCGMCGQPVRIENRRHGRDTSPSLWFVHTQTDRVPCESADEAAQRAAESRIASHIDSAPPPPELPHHGAVNETFQGLLDDYFD